MKEEPTLQPKQVVSSNVADGIFEPVKRKIIKKELPEQLKKKLKRNDEDSKDDWKPQKLSEIKQKTDPKNNIVSKGLSFLANLPKPQNTELARPASLTFTNNRPKIKPVIDMSNLTQQQIKYDVQDSTFIVKQLVSQAKNEKDEIDPDDIVPVPQQYQKQDIKDINQGQLIDTNWEQKQRQKQMKLSMVDELKNTLGQMNKNNNDINFLVDQALRRNQIEEYDITQKADSFKKRKQRYGW